MKHYLVFSTSDQKDLELSMAMGNEWDEFHSTSTSLISIIDAKDNTDPYFANNPVQMVYVDTQHVEDRVLPDILFDRIVLPYSPTLPQKFPKLFTALFKNMLHLEKLPVFDIFCTPSTMNSLEEVAVTSGISPDTETFYQMFRLRLLQNIARNFLMEEELMLFEEKFFSEKSRHESSFNVKMGLVASDKDFDSFFKRVLDSLKKFDERNKKENN
jgi:hypothetical protein